MKSWWHFKSYPIKMGNMENIVSQLQETGEKIENLDNKINTDDELITHSKEIKWIYKNIGEIDGAIKQIKEDGKKQDVSNQLFEIKRLFADLMNDSIINWDFKDVKDERRFDSVNKSFISNLEDIIANNRDKIDVPKINIEEAKNKLLNSDLTYELIESIDGGLTDEEKIVLLKELTKEWILPENISFLALWFGFQTWVLAVWEDWETKVSYIDYWSWCMIIDWWEIIYGEDYETAYMKYITENMEVTEDIENNQIKITFWKLEKSTTYTLDTDNLEKMNKFLENLQRNVAKWKSPDVYEFIYKIWYFSKIELNWWKDSIKAEIYGKWTTWWSNFKLWAWVWLSYTHKWNNITSTTSLWASTNLVTFSTEWPKWKTSYKFDVTQKIQFKNWLLLQGKAYTNTKDINAEVAVWYKKWNVEFTTWVWTNGAVASVKYNIPPSRKRR